METEVVALFSSIRAQVDMMTALASGGLAFILFRVVGYNQDSARKLERPLLLVAATVSFVLAVVLGFVIAGNISGFWTEVIADQKDARAYIVEDETDVFLGRRAFAQIVLVALGVVLVVSHVWYSTRFQGVSR